MAIRDKVSSFGKFLSGMVMPNIGAFIAWGFLTSLFIEAGWLPNEQFASMVGPMLSYLIPILIAAQGGYMVGGDRGRVIGAIAVIGCILGAPDTTMLMGAMVMGPIAGWVIKTFDRLIDGKTPAGFEMLVDNFSLGIIGMLLAMLGCVAVGPIMDTILALLMGGVQFLISYSLMPLLAIFIEPAKVLFLNNAINHGIFTPIGMAQAETAGRSIMYMLEANPGPGLGVLLAYCFFSRDSKARQSAPGAVVIHFLGGIHEIYFPYVLMNPRVIIAPIVGNIAAIAWFTFTGAGLTSAASPGSIIAFMSMTPPDLMVTNFVGVALAAGISFAIAAPIVRSAAAADLEGAAEKMREMKGTSEAAAITGTEGSTIVFACDAGMGSSAMGATRFRNRLAGSRPDLKVLHSSVDTVPADAGIVVCQRALSERARRSAPTAQIVTIDNFLDDPELDSLFEALTTMSRAHELVAGGIAAPALKETGQKKAPALEISEADVQVGLASLPREAAIRASGELLVKKGCADAGYIDAMVARDRLTSVYLGMGVAIPHGTAEAKDAVKKTGVVIQQYPEGIDFDGEKAYLLVGIAGKGNEHLDVLAAISGVLEDEAVLERMKTTDDASWIVRVLTEGR